MVKYEYQAVVIDNSLQSILQVKRSRPDESSQVAGYLFTEFLKTVTDEGWRIIAVTPRMDVIIYHLERPLIGPEKK